VCRSLARLTISALSIGEVVGVKSAVVSADIAAFTLRLATVMSNAVTLTVRGLPAALGPASPDGLALTLRS
jgi:hypothetical protein